MTSPGVALRIVLENLLNLPVISIKLQGAVGYILAEDVKSDRNQPPFNKALMDGIALSSLNTQRSFNIEKVISAGSKPYRLKDKFACVQIMTGAVIPQGCDTIIPIEQINIEDKTAHVKNWTMVQKGQNMRLEASDAKKGQVLIKKGQEILPVHIGVLASVGKAVVKVHAKPRVAIIASGDELVDLNKAILPYQTRLSNSYALKAVIDSAGLGHCELFHMKDNVPQMLKVLSKALKGFDILVLSGGVSMGEYDHVPKVLSQLKVKQLFHKVSQRPGKPFWFGVAPGKRVVFALPGNPVSTLICAYRYLIPYLHEVNGRKYIKQQITIKENPHIQSDLTHFLLVKDGFLVKSSGSGDFSSLTQADGFIEYDSHETSPLRPYFSWRV